MRRGLISQSKTELPDAVLDARIALVRTAMGEAGRDALLLYSNNTRPAAVSWLTGFVPYWSEALLLLLHDRPPVLVVALTYRVKRWIEATSRIAEVIHTPRPGAEAGRLIADVKADAALAVPDLDHMPAGIVEDLRATSPRLVVTDATSDFALLRAKADPTEIAFGAKAAWIAYCALAAPSPDNIARGNLNAIIAAIEGEARRLGAEEIYIAAAPDLARDAHLRRIEEEAAPGKSFAIRASVAYKGTWIRLVRTFADRELIQEATRSLSTAVAGLPDDRGFAPFASWLIEGCRVAQPLETLLGSRIEVPTAPFPGALVSVQVQVQVGSQATLVGAPALLGSAGEAASLLIHPVF
jgi:Xaa-Pro aminopeptidase